MKKSLFLLMFAFAMVVFDACAIKARGLLTKRPVVVVAVSATAAGVIYALIKLINEYRKKDGNEYNAKKIAAIVGIGAGVVAAAYLYLPNDQNQDILYE